MESTSSSPPDKQEGIPQPVSVRRIECGKKSLGARVIRIKNKIEDTFMNLKAIEEVSRSRRFIPTHIQSVLEILLRHINDMRSQLDRIDGTRLRHKRLERAYMLATWFRKQSRISLSNNPTTPRSIDANAVSLMAFTTNERREAGQK